MSHIIGSEQDVVHKYAFGLGGGGSNPSFGRLDTRRQGLHFALHATQYATGVLEGMQVVEGVDGKPYILFLNEHAARLINSASTVGLFGDSPAPSIEVISQPIIATAQTNWCVRNPQWPLYLRPWIGEGSCALGVGSAAGWTQIVTSRNKTSYLGPLSQNGVTIWAPGPDVFCRPDQRCGFPHVKSSINYAAGYRWKTRAAKLDAQEVLQYCLDGTIAETTGSNLFLVIRGVVYTPPLGCILPGLTRRRVIDLLRALDVEVREVPITREMMLKAEEVWLTGTWAGIVPVRRILEGVDQAQPMLSKFHDQDPGPVTRLLRVMYDDLLRRNLQGLPTNFQVNPEWWHALETQRVR